MARTFDAHIGPAYTRRAMMAIEVLDAVSLERLSSGVTVTAVGLRGKPIVNHGGLFVWLEEDLAAFDKLVIDPGELPHFATELPAAAIGPSPHTVRLYPRMSYPFTAGMSAVRGFLVESDPPNAPPPPWQPIAEAVIRLEWLDADGVTWHSTAESYVTDAAGQFAAFVRLAPDDQPLVDANGDLTLRFLAKRGATTKQLDLNCPQGRVADETLAWDQMV